MILILSNKWDITADFIVLELQRLGHPFLRINTEDLISSQFTLSLPRLELIYHRSGLTYSLTEQITAIWNRRPEKPSITIGEGTLSKAKLDFIDNQWGAFLEALQLIPDVLWVNNPKANRLMDNKIYQLHTAAKFGFTIPPTSITNSGKALRQFAKDYSSVVAKALDTPLMEEKEKDYFIFTNRLSEEHVHSWTETDLTPTIFQQCIAPKVDYRITVVGNSVFSVKIMQRKASSDVSIDWRADKEQVDFLLYSLPTYIENMCVDYVHQNGLIFGAIDLVEKDGIFYFLEINPNGEWGWLQKPLNLPIAEQLCQVMITHGKKK